MALSDYYPEMKGWTPVAASEPANAPQIADKTTTISPFLRTTIPLPFIYSPDTLRQYNRPEVSAFRISPLQANAIPTINAAAQSIVAKTPPAVSAGGLTSVGLGMPAEYSVANSPLTSNGTLAVSWNPEPPNYFLGGSLNSNGDVVDVAVTADNPSGSATSLVFPRAFPKNANEFVFLKNTTVPTGGAAGITPTGFVQLPSDSTAYTIFPSPQPLQTNSTTGVTLVFSSVSTVDGVMLSFNTTGSAPAVTHPSSYALNVFSNPSTGTAFTMPAGQTWLVVISTLTTNKTYYTSITDNLGNAYVQTAWTSDTGRAMQAFVVQGTLGGTCQMVISWSSSAPPNSATVDGYAITNLATSGLPKFRAIQQRDLPPIDLGQATGIVSVKDGGTGANLSSTGGSGQVLQQTSTGVAITVGQLAISQLLNSTFLNLTNQSANVTPTTLFSAPNAGLYRISVYTIVTRVETTSTLPDTQIIYTDADNSTAITVATTAGSTGNLLTTTQSATVVINAKASTNIQYAIGQVTAYASSPAGMLFSYHARVEYLG